MDMRDSMSVPNLLLERATLVGFVAAGGRAASMSVISAAPCELVRESLLVARSIECRLGLW